MLNSKSKWYKVSGKRQVEIEVETHYETERFKKYILSQGKLGFYEVYKLEDMMPFLQDVNELVKDTRITTEEVNPLFDLVAKEGYSEQGSVLFYVQEKDTALVRQYIYSKEAASSFKKKKNVKFLWV